MSTNKDLKKAAVPERSASSALADRLKNICGSKGTAGVGGEKVDDTAPVSKNEALAVKGPVAKGEGLEHGQRFFVKARKVPEKSTMMTIRTKPEVKEDFDELRNFFGFSQSDFFEKMLAITKEQARKEGWNG